MNLEASSHHTNEFSQCIPLIRRFSVIIVQL